jgi:hypothetical protein
MPDFDTRRPPGTKRPSKLHVFVAASKQHMSAVASRLRTSARALLRNKNMIQLLGLGLSFLLLTVLAGVIIVWAAKTTADQRAGPPTEQLSQKIQTPPTPAHNYLPEDPSKAGEDNFECELENKAYFDFYDANCSAVNTKAADPVKLASITQQIKGGQHASVLQLEFNRRTEDWYQSGSPQATSYCFEIKENAVYALGGHLDEAELLGKTKDCFVIVYEGDGPHIRCADRTAVVCSPRVY